MDIEQNQIKIRVWKIFKIVMWTSVFILLYETVHLLNDESSGIANWWIGLMSMGVCLTLYLIPTNKYFFRKTRWLWLMLFAFFLGWFLADLGEFIDTVRFLLNAQI